MKLRLIKPLLILLMTLSCLVTGAQPASDNRRLRFAWGAGMVGNIEMSEHDMSAIGIDASFGMEWRWIRFLGVNAEADIMVNNSSRIFPLTLNFRTDFCQKPQLLFMDIRGGVAISSMAGFKQETQPYGSAGLGITLAKGHDFSSHIILAYTYLMRDQCYHGQTLRNCPGMQFATMRLGVKF